jgi:hypothetical protein
VLAAATVVRRQPAFRGLHTLRGAELLELGAWHHHLDEQTGFADSELELDHAVVVRLHDADEAALDIPAVVGRGRCGSHAPSLARDMPESPESVEISIIFGKTLIFRHGAALQSARYIQENP